MYTRMYYYDIYIGAFHGPRGRKGEKEKRNSLKNTAKWMEKCAQLQARGHECLIMRYYRVMTVRKKLMNRPSIIIIYSCMLGVGRGYKIR